MKWLNSPYPLLQNARYKWLFALLSGLFVFVFLIFFQPFGASQSIAYKHFFLAGFGVAVFFGMATTYFIPPKLFREFFCVEKWTIGKEILLQSCCILIISAFNSLHNYNWWRDIDLLMVPQKIGQ